MHQKIVLISTGLGKVDRGFEIYIASLGKLLDKCLMGHKVFVFGSGSNVDTPSSYVRINSVFRSSRLAFLLFRSSSKNRLMFERFTFFLAMLPMLIRLKPDVLYLGEYALYCWLYKFRKISGMAFRLVLYTGGQAIPGVKLFDPSRDFIHHITDSYLDNCRHFPASRQMLLPHFVVDDFTVDNALFKKIRTQAAGKYIVLSVGAIEKSSKRMHWLVEALALCKHPVFPILLGEPTADYDEILALLHSKFGMDGYILAKVPRPELGTYYQAADLFVSCSPKESFGLVFVEALLFGLPIICDDFKEVRFVLQDQAYYTFMKSPEAVALAINDVFADFSTVTSAAAKASRRQFAQDHYSIESLQPGYQKLFERI